MHDEASESVLSVLERGRARGYGADLEVVSTGEGTGVRCGACGTVVEPRRLVVHDHVRLEGASDPADLQLVVFARCPECGAQGALVLGYGPNASEADSRVELELRLPRAAGRVAGT
ncbi:MAG: HNH endonuclease [Actinomyces sp.]|nr:MAG: HNH endonuclease [Actinomyces sp.]